ncbi:MAG TPA: acetylglutamate kinase [Gammaproteobacteria bacterium]|nr:acetylglutamate kinase [Gammaproteobacteria bacterium]
MQRRDADDFARVLTEALPYIQRFQGKTIVIKYGGSAMVDSTLKQSFARDIVLMKLVGMNPVIVHGGGPQISSTLQKIGKESRFVNGLRVTDSETMDIVEMVLGGLVNKDIVNQINRSGGRAVGLSGKDGDLIRACKLVIDSPGQGIDYGFVGRIQSIQPAVVTVLEQQNFIPVIAPIGVGDDGHTYNINADTVAGRLATTLQAEKLILLTDTTGVMQDGTLLPRLNSARVQELIDDAVIRGGMLPKVGCAIDAISTGVTSAHIIDGRISHAVLLEIFTNHGVGTQILG